jgi:ATP-dependent RNA helicase DDX60
MVNDGGTLKEGVGQFAAHQILTRHSSHEGHFLNAVLSVGVAARDILTSHEQGPFDQIRSCVLGKASVSLSFFDLRATYKDVELSYLSVFKSDAQQLLLAVFIIRVLLLKNVSIQDRARRLLPMKPDHFTSLAISFLPHIVANDASLNIDIRVFLCILRYLSEHPAQSLTEALTGAVLERVKIPSPGPLRISVK